MEYQEPQQQEPYFASFLEQDNTATFSYSHMLSSAYDLTTANIEDPWNWYLDNEQHDARAIPVAPFPQDVTLATTTPPQSQYPIFSTSPSPDMHHLSPSPTMSSMPTMMLSPSPEPLSYHEEFPMYFSPTSTNYTATMDTPTGDPQDLVHSLSMMNFDYNDHDVASTGIATPPSSPMLDFNRPNAPSSPRRRVYKCDICNKTFTRPYNLRSHQRTHTDERPYHCDDPGCDLRFARPHDLKRHQLLHSGIKPHKCEHCGNARFYRRDALRKHWDKVKECGDAEKRFPTSKPYRRRRATNKIK